MAHSAFREFRRLAKRPTALPAARNAIHTRLMRRFDDRTDSGRQLASRVDSLRGQDVIVLGLPRDGVPVAFEVAKALQAPLDVLVLHKLERRAALFDREQVGEVGVGVQFQGHHSALAILDCAAK